MLLGSSLPLLPPVLVIPSPSDVLLVGTGMGSLPGDWVAAMSVAYYTAPHMMVVVLVVHSQVVHSQLHLGLGLEQQVLLPSHQH